MRKIALYSIIILICGAALIIGWCLINPGVSLVCEKVDKNEGLFFVNNKGWLTYTCGMDDYEVECYLDGYWQPLSHDVPIVSHPALYNIKAYGKAKIVIDFKEVYGALIPGRYRIAKKLTRKSDGQEMKLIYEFEIK